MKKYGIPYRGSKNAIAEDIVKLLPPAEYFVDLFGGGCAITHCAMLSGKWEKFIVNDINDTPKLFKQAIEGDLKDYCTIPTREEFHDNKNTDVVIKLINSFGNDGTSYAYGREKEEWKVHAQRMLSMPSLYERRREYRKFVKALKERIPSGRLEDLESLQSLERLERLESLQSLGRLEIYQGDYMDVKIPTDSTIYCDIPYVGTNCGTYQGFDHERFYKWLSIIDHPVFVSEYTAPPDTIGVFSIKKRVNVAANDNSQTADEKVFLQSRYAGWWAENKNKEPHQMTLFDELEKLNQ